MTRRTDELDCVVMYNILNICTHSIINPLLRVYQCEWERMTRMTGPDCAVMCSLINTDTHTLQQPLSFRTRRHLCRQGVMIASTRQLRSQSPVSSVHAHRTEGVTESEVVVVHSGYGWISFMLTNRGLG